MSRSQAEAGELALSIVCHSVSGTDPDNPFYFLLITVSYFASSLTRSDVPFVYIFRLAKRTGEKWQAFERERGRKIGRASCAPEIPSPLPFEHLQRRLRARLEVRDRREASRGFEARARTYPSSL